MITRHYVLPVLIVWYIGSGFTEGHLHFDDIGFEFEWLHSIAEKDRKDLALIALKPDNRLPERPHVIR